MLVQVAQPQSLATAGRRSAARQRARDGHARLRRAGNPPAQRRTAFAHRVRLTAQRQAWPHDDSPSSVMAGRLAQGCGEGTPAHEGHVLVGKSCQLACWIDGGRTIRTDRKRVICARAGPMPIAVTSATISRMPTVDESIERGKRINVLACCPGDASDAEMTVRREFYSEIDCPSRIQPSLEELSKDAATEAARVRRPPKMLCSSRKSSPIADLPISWSRRVRVQRTDV